MARDALHPQAAGPTRHVRKQVGKVLVRLPEKIDCPPWLAVVAAAIVFAAPLILANATPIQAIPLVLLGVWAGFAAQARFGLVAGMVGGGSVSSIVENFPATFPPNQWYSGAGFAGLAVVAALAIYACRIATGSRRPSPRG